MWNVFKCENSCVPGWAVNVTLSISVWNISACAFTPFDDLFLGIYWWLLPMPFKTVCIPAMECDVCLACYTKFASQSCSALAPVLHSHFLENRHTHQNLLVFTVTGRPSTERLSLVEFFHCPIQCPGVFPNRLRQCAICAGHLLLAFLTIYVLLSRVKQVTRDFTQFLMFLLRWTNGPVKRSCGQRYWQVLPIIKNVSWYYPPICRRMQRWCTTLCTWWLWQCSNRSRSPSALCSVIGTSLGASGGVSSASSKRYDAISSHPVLTSDVEPADYCSLGRLYWSAQSHVCEHFFCKSL